VPLPVSWVVNGLRETDHQVSGGLAVIEPSGHVDPEACARCVYGRNAQAAARWTGGVGFRVGDINACAFSQVSCMRRASSWSCPITHWQIGQAARRAGRSECGPIIDRRV
jgi:hypothetical protein